jgi:type II secretion system protein N
VARFQLPFQLPQFNLGRRSQLALRYTGIAFVAILTFLFALQMTFPYERVRDKGIEALSSSYDVTVGSVERGIIPGRVYFKGVTLRTRPTKPDEVVTTFYIEKIQIDLSFLSLLRLNGSADIDAKIGAGSLKGSVTLLRFGKNGVKLDLEGKDLPGASLPFRGVIGLPITGKIEASVDLELPTSKNKMGRTLTDWTKADGTIELSCPSGCTIGDGHTKLKPLLKNRSQQVMVQEGIDFGKVNIDTLVARAVFTPANGDPDAHSSSYKPGKLEITKFEVKSPDGELHVDYAQTMAQEFGESMVAGCLRFKGSESLLKKEETKRTYAAISTTGAELRSDGLFHIKLTDRFKDMKRLNMECGPNVKSQGNGEDFTARPGGGIRPGLTPVTPEGGSGTPPPNIRTGIGQTQPPTGTPPPPSATPPPPPEPNGSAGSATTTSSPPVPPIPAEGAAAGSAAAEPQPGAGAPVR